MSTCKFLKPILLYSVLLFLLACELQVPNEIVVNIISPQNGQSFEVGETITFTGSATDPLNGALQGESLVWTSSIEGEIGSGNDFSRDDLSLGSHTITLTATNSIGDSKTDSINITVLSEEVQHLQLESKSFADGEIIPIKYTCDGDDLSPNVSWSNIPEGTASFVIIMEDPDAPFGTFTHWVVFDIPYSVNILEEGFPEKRQTEGIKDGGTYPRGSHSNREI